MKVWLAVRSIRRARTKRRSSALGEGNHVVQFFRPGFKETTQVARRLADALLIFDQREAHETFAVFAECDTRRDRQFRLFNQQCRELDAADALERYRQRRPREHRGPWWRTLPAGAAEAFHE